MPVSRFIKEGEYSQIIYSPRRKRRDKKKRKVSGEPLT